MKKIALMTASLLVLSLTACQQRQPVEGPNETITASVITPEKFIAESNLVPQPVDKADKFTYANYKDVRMTHLHLDLNVDFGRKVLDGFATIDFEKTKPDANILVLDTRKLKIYSVETFDGVNWKRSEFGMSEEDELLGQAMTIAIGDKVSKVRIRYSTSPEAEGLQWLSPSQTAGKEHPYMFSQGQPIHARTMAPVQDTPAVRITYSAKLRTPNELVALMSADQDPYTPRDGEYEFNMPQPIPAYLLAFAVGDIDFKAINDHIGVYAEEYILEASAVEFSETPQMEVANADLYGPYRWGRYDLIVLPPSFPFGGMENPRLSFLTPTLVAGDKSLTNVVAHELAHSWSGNLVTNATWRDAWLNEGFTSYVENRIMEVLYGEERAIMEQSLDMQGLKRAIGEAKREDFTHLKMPEDMSHPDDAFTLVSYIKGANFLFFLEDRFGRKDFDPFLKDYFDTYAFKSVTTEDFLNYLNDNLRNKFPDAVSDAEINAWVYGPGLPETARNPVSSAFVKVRDLQTAWLDGKTTAAGIDSSAWSTHEWLAFINTLPEGLSSDQMKDLDSAFNLTGNSNAEIAFVWYMQAIKNNYEPAMSDLQDFLMEVGRGKFIYRIYAAMKDHGRLNSANEIYAKARSGYHPIAQRRIDAILGDE